MIGSIGWSSGYNINEEADLSEHNDNFKEKFNKEKLKNARLEQENAKLYKEKDADGDAESIYCKSRIIDPLVLRN